MYFKIINYQLFPYILFYFFIYFYFYISLALSQETWFTFLSAWIGDTWDRLDKVIEQMSKEVRE